MPKKLNVPITTREPTDELSTLPLTFIQCFERMILTTSNMDGNMAHNPRKTMSMPWNIFCSGKKAKTDNEAGKAKNQNKVRNLSLFEKTHSLVGSNSILWSVLGRV